VAVADSPDSALARALRMLDEVCAEPIPTGPVELSPFHRAAIAWLESLPQNQSGVDKTWVEEADKAWREHYAGARRVR
jgi:hypothetical protein